MYCGVAHKGWDGLLLLLRLDSGEPVLLLRSVSAICMGLVAESAFVLPPTVRTQSGVIEIIVHPHRLRLGCANAASWSQAL